MINKKWIGLIFFLLLLGSNHSVGQSIELDKKLGAENAEMVKIFFGLYQDEEMTNYVKEIGERLVAKLDKNPFEFQFHIADDPLPNAFALPGGYIYVTRGILSLAKTEDELACVMAHEIIHVTERHSIKQMRSSIIPSLLEVPGAIVGTVVSDDLGSLINSPINTTSSLFLSSYSRKHETESDTKGIELASKAGYDPTAMGDILARLSDAVEVLTNEKEKKSYFDDHPYTPNRVKKINKVSTGLAWDESPKLSDSFPMPFDGMIFGANPKKGIFKGQTFLHPDLGFTITFPDGWHTSNQPTSVNAIHEDRRAGMFLGLEAPGKAPEEYAKAFENEIRKQHKASPYRSESRVVNSHEGYIVSMEDNTGNETMYIHILWVKVDGLIFKLIGFAPRTLESELKESALSLRTLTSSERKNVEMRTMKIVRAKENETVKELIARSNNVLKIDVVNVINDLEKDAKLKENEAIKIAVNELYSNN